VVVIILFIPFWSLLWLSFSSHADPCCDYPFHHMLIRVVIILFITCWSVLWLSFSSHSDPCCDYHFHHMLIRVVIILFITCWSVLWWSFSVHSDPCCDDLFHHILILVVIVKSEKDHWSCMTDRRIETDSLKNGHTWQCILGAATVGNHWSLAPICRAVFNECTEQRCWD
jgi:hypothetical protein